MLIRENLRTEGRYPFGTPPGAQDGAAARMGAEEAQMSVPDQAPDPMEQPPSWARDLLEECARDWRAMEEWRENRRHARNDYRGYQWQRKVEDPQNPGSYITEKELIERQGRIAIKMNHIAPVIRNLKGQLLQNQSGRMVYAVDREDSEAANQMTVARDAVRRVNSEKQLEADQFEEHLLSGMHAYKHSAQYMADLDRNEIEVDAVDVTRLFFNRDLSDRRMKNLRRIGEMHEVTLDELVEQLATSPEHEAQIRDVYAGKDYGREDQARPTGFAGTDSVNFYYATDQSKCRVFEVWYKEWEWVTLAFDPMSGQESIIDWSREEIEMEQEMRAALGAPALEIEETKEHVWHYAFLSPEGHVLDGGRTPYWHQEHPYTIGFAQWRDGEWWGLVDDIQDPQRLINRITAAIDFMMAASAKGVLLVDEDVLDESEMDIDEIADKWTSFNGVIALKPKGNQTVSSSIKQVTASAVPAGLFEWLAQQKQWVEELSGVLGAQQGHAPSSGTPASLYAQQQVQASMTTLIFFETFFNTAQRLDRKVVQCIAQYYDQSRMIRTAERAPFVQYDPERVRNMTFDVVMADTADTATFRMQFEETLREFLGAGFLTFPQFLEVSAHPKAQQIQELVQRTNPLLQDTSALQQADPELAGALINAAESGDVEARTLVQQAQDVPAGGMQQTQSAQGMDMQALQAMMQQMPAQPQQQ